MNKYITNNDALKSINTQNGIITASEAAERAKQSMEEAIRAKQMRKQREQYLGGNNGEHK